MEEEITTHAVDFIKRNASAGKPFFAYVSFSLIHMPTLPHPEFAGKTGNGDWADCLAEMDYRTGQILDAIKEAGVEDNTLVVFTSDNGPEATHPWEGDSGPWRGTYFTAMEASLRAPFIIRWPGKVPAGRVSNEIVHIVDMFTTLARWAERRLPAIARSTASINWISSLANRKTPTAKDFPPSWQIGCPQLSGVIGRCT